MSQDLPDETQPPQSEAASAAARATCEALVAALGDNLFAAYLHGSAVLGGYRSDRSDLDILAIANQPLADSDLENVVALLGGGAYPAKGLELSIVTRAEAALADTPAPRFQLHLATTGREGTVRAVDGRHRPGDRDLILHFAVCRAAGVALRGPAPSATLRRISPGEMRLALLDEIDWRHTTRRSRSSCSHALGHGCSPPRAGSPPRSKPARRPSSDTGSPN